MYILVCDCYCVYQYSSAISFATFIRGTDVETRMLRRTLVRYMVLTQALVLRDISLQVRKRFPTLDTLEAAGKNLCSIENLKNSMYEELVFVEFTPVGR